MLLFVKLNSFWNDKFISICDTHDKIANNHNMGTLWATEKFRLSLTSELGYTQVLKNTAK